MYREMASSGLEHLHYRFYVDAILGYGALYRALEEGKNIVLISCEVNRLLDTVSILQKR